MDLSGNLTFFNDSMCKISGYSRDELMGMNNRQLMDVETAKKIYQVFNRVYRTGMPSRLLDWELTRKGKSRKDVEASISLIKDSKGTPTGFRGVLRDVSDRKQAEEALIEAQQRYQSLFESKTNLVFVVDDQGNFIDANDLALDLFEYEKDDLYKTNYFQLLHPDQSLESLTEAIKEIMETGAQKELLEIKLQSKTGKTVYVQSGGTLIRGKNEIIGVARDIT